MPLPEFDIFGDLPPGVHRATLNEVIQRFSSAGGQRGVCTLRLSHVHELAQRTGQLQRFIIFGSYVTTQPNPNDIDVVLVMGDTFRLEECPIESRGLFEHAVAQARYGASIFWIRPVLLIGEGVEDFIAYWQLKRNGSRRGIVEVIPMIANDQELKVTQERIAHLQRWLVQIRQNARPEEFEAVASSYRLEIERMQAEVLEYLLRPLPAEREDAA